MRTRSEGRTDLVLPGRVQARHLDRLAIVYVRQSTLQQLEQHRESTALQYGLAERAYSLGWPRPRVSVIDDDLGRSVASAEGRPGFQRLVAEGGLGHVGLVLGFEVSRLARSWPAARRDALTAFRPSLGRAALEMRRFGRSARAGLAAHLRTVREGRPPRSARPAPCPGAVSVASRSLARHGSGIAAQFRPGPAARLCRAPYPGT